MNDDIFISVVIPTYNSEKYVLSTLESVYRQTVLPFEIVVCDDGSTDNTIALIEDFFEKNSIIISNTKVVRQSNKGAGAARNNAIKNASGNWIAFLDSDDSWLPDKLEKVVQIIKTRDEIGIISHDEYGVNENNIIEKKITKYSEMYSPSKNLFIQLFNKNFFSTSCMIVRKDLIEQVGFMDESLRSAQDYDLWLRVSQDQKAVIIHEPLAYYLTRKNNISSNTYRRYLCELKIIEKNRNEVCRILGVKAGRRVVAKKIIKIHLAESHAAFRNEQFGSMFKIGIRFLPVLIRTYIH